MSALTTRREFLCATAVLAAVAAGRTRAEARGAAGAGLVVPTGHPAADSVRAGATFGAEEAARQASLLRASFELETTAAATPEEAAAAARGMAERGLVVLGGVDAATCRALAAAVPTSFVAVHARDELDSDEPAAGALAVTPGFDAHAEALVRALARRGIVRCAFDASSDVTRDRALAAGLEEVGAASAQVLFATREGAPRDRLVAGVTLPAAPGRAVPVGWHASLHRYGASELNDRFRRATGAAMDEHAWYGWVAVKLIAEAALRKRPIAETRIDGHKGRALHFAGRSLEQPLYVLLQPPGGELEVIDADADA